MDVVMVYPKSEWKFSTTPFPPLGVAYIAAGLLNHSYCVKIIDGVILSEKSYDKEIEEIDCNIVCISATIIQLNELFRISQIVKEKNPEAIIIVGGAGPVSVGASYVFSNSAYIDYYVAGEGDFSVPLLVDEIKNNSEITVPNVYYQDSKGKICHTRVDESPISIDSLPFPARNLLDMNAYRNVWVENSGSFTTSMISSRGCPFSCSFCYPSLGKQHRMRSPELIVDEMEMLANDFCVDHIGFWDDLFTVNKKRVIEICELLQKRNLKVNWDCHARVDTIDSEVVIALKKSGCKYLCFGVESGSDRILKQLQKGFEIEQARQAFNLCRENNMLVGSYFIVGVPGEQIKDIEATISFISETKPYIVNLSFLTPYPGTQLYSSTSNLIKHNFEFSKYNEMNGSVYNLYFEMNPIESYNKIVKICKETPEIVYHDGYILSAIG